MSNTYLWAELRTYMDRIFTILLFLIFVHYFGGRKPLPKFSNKQSEILCLDEPEPEPEEDEEEDLSHVIKSELEEGDEETIIVNAKKMIKNQFNFHVKGKKRPVYETFDLDGNQENWKFEIKEDPLFDERLATLLFDFQHWNPPFQAIKTDRVTAHLRKDRFTANLRDPIQNRMSEYFFHTCRSDGKERISFTYPSVLSTFLEKIQRKISLLTTEKLTSTELYNPWNSNNEQRKKTLSNEFLNRVKNLDKGFPIRNILEKRTRLCRHKRKKEYLPKLLDPVLCGHSRGKVHFQYAPFLQNKVGLPLEEIENENFGGMANKMYLILLTTNYQEFEPKIDTFNRKSFSIKIAYFLNLVNEFVLNLINEFAGKSLSNFIFKGLSLFPARKEEKIDLQEDDRILI